jgi:mono/diheme cytochrome c family protein
MPKMLIALFAAGLICLVMSTAFATKDSPLETPIAEQAVTAEPADLEIGKTLFQQCAACHLASGEGVKGVFPPLRGRMADIAATQIGREYLASVVLQGMDGAIKVNEQTYMGYMQAFAKTLNDQQLSSVLNYGALKLSDTPVVGFELFDEKEINDVRVKLEKEPVSSLQLRKNAVH